MGGVDGDIFFCFCLLIISFSILGGKREELVSATAKKGCSFYVGFIRAICEDAAWVIPLPIVSFGRKRIVYGKTKGSV